MKKLILFWVTYIFLTVDIPLVLANASQSTITEAEGYACMGDDKSRKQTEQQALTEAKRKAVEQVATYISSQTEVKDFELQKDMIEAYAKATVKIIQELEKTWYRDQSLGDCYRIKIKAEVIPEEKAMKKISESKLADDPSAPLHVQVWTDKRDYKAGEKIKIYLKGNKPFYALVHYIDTKGEVYQLLPNPYRKENYFNGGVVYEIPSGNDRFELEVSPPFGEESVVVYASTSKPGDLNVEETGGVYQVKTRKADIGDKTRGIKLKEKSENKSSATEFFENKTQIFTKGEK